MRKSTAFSDKLHALFWTGTEQLLTEPENEYYQKYVLLKEFGIKPHEIELIPIEDLNALWTLYEYEIERKNHDAFKSEGKK